ncbi:MAG: gas vesicle protein, partial [Acidimicrobiales bacterium]
MPSETESDRWPLSSPTYGGSGGSLSRGDTSNLADILERVLDKGIVIAGDISISLVDVELLTIKLRLLIASVDKAREMGIN